MPMTMALRPAQSRCHQSRARRGQRRAAGLGTIRHELREAAHAGLVAHIGKRRRIGLGLGRRQRRAGARHQLSHGHVGIGGAPGAPGDEAFGERPVAGAERGVHHQQAGEALGHVHRQGEPDQPAPILADQGDVVEVEPLDEGEERVAVEVEGVDPVLDRLVGAAEAEEIRRHGAVAGGGDEGNELAIEIAPARLAVEAEEDPPRCARALVEIMQAQPLIAVEVVAVMRRKGKAGQGGEPFFRRAQRFDHHRLPSVPGLAPPHPNPLRPSGRRGDPRSGRVRWGRGPCRAFTSPDAQSSSPPS